MKRHSFNQDRTVLPLVSGGMLATLAVLACAGEVQVGVPGSSGGTSSGSGGEQTIDPPSSGGAMSNHQASGGSQGEGGAGLNDEDCSALDAERKADHLSWEESPNVWGDLIGKTYTGYVEGVVDNLRLTIDEDGDAVLSVGEPGDPPIKEQGRSCWDAFCEGMTYEIRGALYEEGRVRAMLGSPFDPWCELQDPLAMGDCDFGAVGNGPISWTVDYTSCTTDGQPIDCDWFRSAWHCICTSQECFSGPGDKLDARLDENGDIKGALWEGTLYLFEQK